MNNYEYDIFFPTLIAPKLTFVYTIGWRNEIVSKSFCKNFVLIWFNRSKAVKSQFKC